MIHTLAIKRIFETEKSKSIKAIIIETPKVRKSKIAICENCGAFVMASHIDSITRDSEKEFTKLANMGFVIKLETIEETRARKFSFSEDCLNGKCKNGTK